MITGKRCVNCEFVQVGLSAKIYLSAMHAIMDRLNFSIFFDRRWMAWKNSIRSSNDDFEPIQIKDMKMKYWIPMIALLGVFASCEKIKQSATEKVSSGTEQVAEGVKEAAENVAEEAAAAKEAVVTEVKEATEEVKEAAEEVQGAVEQSTEEAAEKAAEGAEEIKEAVEGELPK